MTIAASEISSATDRLIARRGTGLTEGELENLADEIDRDADGCADPEMARAVAMELRRRVLVIRNS